MLFFPFIPIIHQGPWATFLGQEWLFFYHDVDRNTHKVQGCCVNRGQKVRQIRISSRLIPGRTVKFEIHYSQYDENVFLRFGTWNLAWMFYTARWKWSIQDLYEKLDFYFWRGIFFVFDQCWSPSSPNNGNNQNKTKKELAVKSFWLDVKKILDKFQIPTTTIEIPFVSLLLAGKTFHGWKWAICT